MLPDDANLDHSFPCLVLKFAAVYWYSCCMQQDRGRRIVAGTNQRCRCLFVQYLINVLTVAANWVCMQKYTSYQCWFWLAYSGDDRMLLYVSQAPTSSSAAAEAAVRAVDFWQVPSLQRLPFCIQTLEYSFECCHKIAPDRVELHTRMSLAFLGELFNHIPRYKPHTVQFTSYNNNFKQQQLF